jgi:uncharacterized protein
VTLNDVIEEALAYLRTHRVLTLATHGPKGLWAAAVFYASKRFTLYFLSSSRSRHAQNLLASPRVAGTIQEDYGGWREIKGVQLEGAVLRLEGHARDRAIAIYAEKYPFVRDAPEAISVALRAVDWFQVTPDRLYFLDNSRGFGHRERLI